MAKTLIKILLPILIILLGSYFVLKFIKEDHQSSSQKIPVEVGTKVPDFDMHTLNGEVKKLSEITDKVILVNFWATWCTACVYEMPSMRNLQETFKEKGFTVAFLSVDANPKAIVPAYLKKLKIDFETYVDQDQKLAEYFDVHGIPFTAILDKDRRILYLEVGERDWNTKQVKDQISQWLTQNT